MHRAQWNSISARIEGIAAAANLLAQFRRSDSNDSYGIGRFIGKECAKILDVITQFERDNSVALSPEISSRIKEFVEDRGALFSEARDDNDKAGSAIVLLCALRSELTYLLSGEQEVIRSSTERAFMHLQRVLAANEQERKVWAAGLKSGEPACEKLGAAHLLWHGIFAFKVDASGGRTDLVAPEPLDINKIARSAAGLVLTEWKVVDAKVAITKFDEALHQAEIYKAGVLAGIELRGYRFLVGVSESSLPRELGV